MPPPSASLSGNNRRYRRQQRGGQPCGVAYRQACSYQFVVGCLVLASPPVRGADPVIDRLLQSPIGKNWVTNGGNLTNQRFSTLKQIDTSNVKQLKGAWMTRLKGDTGALAKGESKDITFKDPGTYFYICTPHPWMYGQVIVE